MVQVKTIKGRRPVSFVRYRALDEQYLSHCWPEGAHMNVVCCRRRQQHTAHDTTEPQWGWLGGQNKRRKRRCPITQQLVSFPPPCATTLYAFFYPAVSPLQYNAVSPLYLVLYPLSSPPSRVHPLLAVYDIAKEEKMVHAKPREKEGGGGDTLRLRTGHTMATEEEGTLAENPPGLPLPSFSIPSP